MKSFFSVLATFFLLAGMVFTLRPARSMKGTFLIRTKCFPDVNIPGVLIPEG